MKPKQEKRSPLRDKPLRHAGQSIGDTINDKIFSAIMWVIIPMMLLGFMIDAWTRYLYPKPTTSPLLFTILVLVVFIIAAVRIRNIWHEIHRLKMARDGERLVGEGLQELIRQGATVFHDIQGDKFNIDHVVVSQHGIFMIETKTYSKPVKREAVITHDKSNIYVDGYSVDRNPLDQVNALSSWLQDLLQKSTGIKFYIKPVIVFPGWYTEKVRGGEEIWIINPKALPVFIANEPIRLKETDVHLIAFHLSRYIRTFEIK
ncbi:MAG: nuclease-related domain-containing protein [Chloroflexota bacterium]